MLVGSAMRKWKKALFFRSLMDVQLAINSFSDVNVHSARSV
jgi:hypothetical protein